MPAPTDHDPASWQRYFAIQANNRAWALAVAAREAAQDREMLDAAHASAWHWAAVGNELHRMRATMLLAQVHALLGHGATAFAYSSEMRHWFLGADTPDWELAFTHAVHAQAAHAAGETEVHRAAYVEAVAAIAAISDDEDRAIVLETFRLIPPPAP